MQDWSPTIELKPQCDYGVTTWNVYIDGAFFTHGSTDKQQAQEIGEEFVRTVNLREAGKIAWIHVYYDKGQRRQILGLIDES